MLSWFRKKPPTVSAERHRDVVGRLMNEVGRLRQVKAKYDAAQDGEDLRRYWGNADNLSAKAANSHAVRDKLRKRSRYEIANNSYARGMLDTLANDTIGTGPTLQLLGDNESVNRRIESAFAADMGRIDLAKKLRVMRKAKGGDGESFALIKLAIGDRFAPPVDLVLREADYCQSDLLSRSRGGVDGIELDENDNPIAYYFLPHHPGDVLVYSGGMEPIREPASRVIHYFDCQRPGQVRGIPETTPALPLFAQLRRYTLATLTAAETAADFAAILHSQASPDPDDQDDVEPFDVFEIERGMMTTVPRGWALSQLKAEQPTAQYAEFKNQLLNEIARCFGMPFNVAAGNSAGYNYSSGRLDHQTYHRNIAVERSIIEHTILRRIFFAWLDVATELGIVPLGGLPPFEQLRFTWMWDGFPHVDPQKEAAAEIALVQAGHKTYADVYAAQGKDWQEQARQRAREEKFLADLGLKFGATGTPQETESNGSEEEAATAAA